MTKQEEISRENIQDAISNSSYKTLEAYFELNKSQYSVEDLGSLLLEAILVKKLQLVKLFVKLGVDLKEKYQYGGDLYRPLDFAIRNSRIKIINYFHSLGIKHTSQYPIGYFLSLDSFNSKEGCETIIFLMKNNYVTDVNGYSKGRSNLLELINYSYARDEVFNDVIIYALKNGADVNKFMFEDGSDGITILDSIKKSDGCFSLYLEAFAKAEKEILDKDLHSNLPKRTGKILKI